MANAVGLAARYVIEGLEIFLRPVSVLRRSGDRGKLPLAVCIIALVLVAFVTELLALLNEQFPMVSAVGSGLAWRSHIEPFVGMIAFAALSALTLFVGGRLLGRDPSPARALSVNVSLVAAIGGGFAIAMLVKGAVMVASPFDPVLLQHVIWLGPQASVMLGVLIVGYSIIAARFGALVSWPVAVCVALAQLLLFGGIWLAINYTFFTSEVTGVAETIEALRANQGN
ncbi:MAG: hypothetical protein AAFO77_00205 [Pseudomonadota bacterium]